MNCIKSMTMVLMVFLFFTCSDSGEKSEIITVKGSIAANDMGTVLIHEHILVDFIGAKETGYHRWKRDEVVEKVLPYLMQAKAQGVETILECTPAYLGRDPRLLKTLSEKSGLNILTNTGFYASSDDKYVPGFAYQITADSIAQLWINEFENGIENTGIRPGFIKISVDMDAQLSEIDRKIVMAAIKTHQATGLTIVSHTETDSAAYAQLELIKEMGISPQAWVWTHAQEGTAQGRLQVAKSGAWISIDGVNKEDLKQNIEMIDELKTSGFMEQILISHDAGWYDPDQPEGGEINGYTDIFTHLIPALTEQGYTKNEIDQLLIENPKNAYTIRVRIKDNQYVFY